MLPTVTETVGPVHTPYRQAKVSGIGCRVYYDAVDKLKGMTCKEESQAEPDGYTVGQITVHTILTLKQGKVSSLISYRSVPTQTFEKS